MSYVRIARFLNALCFCLTFVVALLVWNNGWPQAGMGFWLKSFDKKPAPLPGTFFTVPQINNRNSGH